MNLNGQQQRAVEIDGRRVLVIAGAGSGKTRVLAERIAHLVGVRKVSGYEIMSFSFTRKASGEIIDRIGQYESLKEAVGSITAGTMHSIALSFLKKYGDEIGFNAQHLTVYNPWEEAFLLKHIATEMGIYKGKQWKIKKRDIDGVFNHYYNTGEPPGENNECKTLFDTFHRRCQENHAITYGGLLTGFYLLIPYIGKYTYFRHILVDEVQDMSTIQWNIIFRMQERWGVDIFAVGDIDQSLYEWRGAIPGFLTRLSQGGTYQVIKLEANYRSVPAIVRSANKLIENNTDRVDKIMFPVRQDDSPIAISTGMDSDKIARLLEKCTDLDMAVLCRVHGPLKKLSEILTERKIHHVYYGKNVDLINSEGFQRYHAFLKLMANPFDNFAFLLAFDYLGLTIDHYRQIRAESNTYHISHFQAYMNIFPDNFFDLLMDTWGDKGLLGVAQAIGSVFFIEDKPFPDAQLFFEDWIYRKSKDNLEDYLDYVATYDLQDEMEQYDPGIKLMTVHGAKGLEWDHVIIAGMNEGILPSRMAINNGEIEAERRVAYVAITRARNKLLLAVRPEWKENKKAYPQSRFMQEMN